MRFTQRFDTTTRRIVDLASLMIGQHPKEQVVEFLKQHKVAEHIIQRVVVGRSTNVVRNYPGFVKVWRNDLILEAEIDLGFDVFTSVRFVLKDVHVDKSNLFSAFSKLEEIAPIGSSLKIDCYGRNGDVWIAVVSSYQNIVINDYLNANFGNHNEN